MFVIKPKVLVLATLFAALQFHVAEIAAVDFQSNFKPDLIWPQITQSGRYFNFPLGVARDAKGFFYVTDSQSNRVKMLSAQGELLRSWGRRGSENGEFNTPVGIALAKTGEVLIADAANNRIQIFNSEGKYLASLGSFGNANGQFNHPNALALDSQGQLYVSDTRNHRIQVFSALGQWIFSFGTLGNAPGQLNNPLGIMLHPNGDIYVVEGAENHRISVFNAQGKFKFSWGKKGSADGEFDSPEYIAADGNGQVYVTEYGNNRIQVFDSQGHWLRSWGKFGFTGPDLWTPYGLAIDTVNQRMYVADTSNNRFQQFDLQGKYLGGWQSQGKDVGEFASPKLSLSPQGEVYVADQQNHRIQVFSASGAWLRSFGSFGTQPGQFVRPNHVHVTTQGQVLVADTGNNRIQVLDLQGNYVKQWGISGSNPGQLGGPGNFTVGNDGNVYITELINNRISVFSLDGKFIRTWGKFGGDKGELKKPDGIVMDAEGLIYVADHDNHRVQVFDMQGTYIREWGEDGAAPGQFSHPHGLALSPSGLLYVADALNNRIQVFKRDGTLVEIVGEAGTQPGQLGQPYNVALADENTVYISELANNRVQKFVRKAPTTHSTYKAIILAGGGPSTDNYENPIWESTELLSNNAYFALRAQDIAKADILYLTSGNTQNDLDEDGHYDDLQVGSFQSLKLAITDWAANADNVIIYLNDHGGDKTFRINQKEILNSKDLKLMLDTLEPKVSGKITVIIEACQSGSFFPELEKSKHVLIASANQEQPAIISNEGITAFSYHFWYGIHSGSNLQNAFKRARQAMSSETVFVNNKPQRQDAQLDANGDGLFNADDFNSLGAYCLGKCKKLAADEPQVMPLTLSGNLNGQTKVMLGMQVSSLAPLSQGWTIISRPDIKQTSPSEPVTDLPSVDLNCTDQGSGQYWCTGEYAKFDAIGDYFITFHARDQKNRSSVPINTVTLTQNGAATSIANDNITYDLQTGKVNIRDATAFGEHYQATLEPSGEFYVLKTILKVNQAVDASAHFDEATNLLLLSKIRVQDHYFRVTLKYLGNYTFALQTLKDLGQTDGNTGIVNASDIGVDEKLPSTF